MTKYRVVYNRGWYYPQFKKWWMPFYVPCFWFGMNNDDYSTLDSAKKIIALHKISGKTVYEE